MAGQKAGPRSVCCSLALLGQCEFLPGHGGSNAVSADGVAGPRELYGASRVVGCDRFDLVRRRRDEEQWWDSDAASEQLATGRHVVASVDAAAVGEDRVQLRRKRDDWSEIQHDFRRLAVRVV